MLVGLRNNSAATTGRDRLPCLHAGRCGCDAAGRLRAEARREGRPDCRRGRDDYPCHGGPPAAGWSSSMAGSSPAMAAASGPRRDRRGLHPAGCAPRPKGPVLVTARWVVWAIATAALSDREWRGGVRGWRDHLRRTRAMAARSPRGTITASADRAGFVDLDALSDLDTTILASTTSGLEEGSRLATQLCHARAFGDVFTRGTGVPEGLCLQPADSQRHHHGAAHRLAVLPRLGETVEEFTDAAHEAAALGCGSISVRVIAPAIRWWNPTARSRPPMTSRVASPSLTPPSTMQAHRRHGGRPDPRHAGTGSDRDLHAGLAATHRRCLARPRHPDPPALLSVEDRV